MAPPSAASDMDRGRRVGKYQILTRLSVGGMAELFLAYTAGPGGFKKFVALKQILPDIKADESFVKMFLDEARITAAFNHANIGQVFDLGEEEDELYLAMEFIAGQNLEQVIKRAAKRNIELPIGFAARVVRDTCLGLHYAHHFVEPSGQPAPVIHRDISPKNVMVTYAGECKVIDFGIAKARGRLGRTQVGVVKGTSGYMSPEQVRNEPLDGRSDLFCTATMLYEMLIKERLFAVAGEVQMMLKIAEEEIPPPHTVNPEIPEALSMVVYKALSKKREDRYATGKEFAKAIDQAAEEVFDEDQMAAVMTQLFDDKIATTRALLELAKSEDTRAMKEKVEELKVDAEASVPTPKKGHKATPGPRPGLATPTKPKNPSKPSMKPAAKEPPPPRRPSKPVKATDVARADFDATIPPRNRADPQKFQATRVFEEQKEEPFDQVPDESEPPDDDESTQKKKTISPKITQDIPAVRAKNKGEELPPPEKKGGGFVGFLGKLAGLGVFAGIGYLGWALWAGPLKDGEYGKMVHAWVDQNAKIDKPEVDTGPKAIDPNVAKAAADDPNIPAWKKKEDEKAALEKAEKERQAAIEAQQNDPEVKKNLEELEAQLKALNTAEEELRVLKFAAAQGSKVDAAQAKKIETLEKQNADMKAQIAAINAKLDSKKVDKRPSAPRSDGVQVVKTEKDAKKMEMGYLTLATVNPNKAKVLLDGSPFGETPLIKIPLEAGTHKLKIVDENNKQHDLSVKIETGKTFELKGIDVESLPLAK